MWCPSCKKQQEQVKLLTSIGHEFDLITIGFDVDPNENAADLKKYTTATALIGRMQCHLKKFSMRSANCMAPIS